MKKLLSGFSLLALFSASVLAGHAEGTFKLLTLDMGKVYDNYYETIESNARIATDGKQAEVDLQRLNAEGQALVEDYKTLKEIADGIGAEDEKAKASKAAQAKYELILQKQKEVVAFRGKQSDALNGRAQDFKKATLEKLRVAAAEIARKKGATALVDTSGPTAYGISNFLYTDPAADITAEVLQQVNAGHAAKPDAGK